ncbi:NAD-dependent epimerase/dehydratase family protein [Gemmata sp. JC717]|uniref:NAD-dependent epimerase/dehydratase family protein n=1 Tax=Gemmata algarum TaxID=2975278 RepID=UPI0021BB443F|nr:NAD-dependent epimerase/dehydratase family protein [Gemmata algarum]MDY3552104.1 NAD-dependent epimerase/dehydratase family protein [Gemmata algarum]
MSATCLITGGAGFIGSHLADTLTAAGRTVRVLDNLTTGLPANLAHISPAPELVQGCVTDPDAVARAVAGCDVVFHLAALASVAKSVEDPLASHAACATGALTVFDAARKAGVRRIVYAGSASAYGNASDEAGQDEATPLMALSPYAAAKLAGEFYAEAFASTYGIETVRLRFFNVFGPRQRADSPYSGVIAIFAGLVAAGRVPTIHGDGLQSRDFVYVSDVARALVLAADTPGVSGRVYNVGTGRSVNLLELIAELNAVLGTSAVPVHSPARPGDVKHSRARIDRIRADLGYEPAVTFAEGLRRTVEWARR